MEKRYAASLAALRKSVRPDVSESVEHAHVAAIINASSKEEATQKAYRACVGYFASQHGYYAHSVNVLEIPE